MKTLQNTTAKYIKIQAESGQCLDNCVIEAIELSMQEKVSVYLDHNGHSYHANFKELLRQVRKEQ